MEMSEKGQNASQATSVFRSLRRSYANLRRHPLILTSLPSSIIHLSSPFIAIGNIYYINSGRNPFATPRASSLSLQQLSLRHHIARHGRRRARGRRPRYVDEHHRERDRKDEEFCFTKPSCVTSVYLLLHFNLIYASQPPSFLTKQNKPLTRPPHSLLAIRRLAPRRRSIRKENRRRSSRAIQTRQHHQKSRETR